MKKETQEKYTKHILDFFEKRPYISIETVEKICELPRGTISQAKYTDRLIPARHIYTILCELSKCGIQDIYGFYLDYDPEGHLLFGWKFEEEEEAYEILTFSDGSKLERLITPEMYLPEYEDKFDKPHVSSSFYYKSKIVKVMYSDYLEL